MMQEALERRKLMMAIDRVESSGAPPALHRPSRVALAWLGAIWLAVAAYVAFTGGWRPGVDAEIAGSVRFASQLAVGLAISGIAAIGALRLSIPGLSNQAHWRLVMLSLAALWLSLFAWDALQPHVEPSMLGKRPGCYREVVAVGLFGSLALLPSLLRRRPMAPRLSAALLFGGATWVSTIAMQVACMVEPFHALTHHVAPAIGMLALGAVVGPLLFRSR